MRHPEKASRRDQPSPRKPPWIRVKAPTSPEYQATRRLMRDLKLNTVCEEAACPNIGECWKEKHATMMILGAVCTRACTFCNVATGRPDLLDPHEPARVGEAVAALGLNHIVVTSVDRDDLDDGGAGHFARTIAAIRAAAPATTIEVLVPDFLRKDGAIEMVVAARPDVLNHNLETVPRLYGEVRPGARYFHSLRLLDQAKRSNPDFTKPGWSAWGRALRGYRLYRPVRHRSISPSAIPAADPEASPDCRFRRRRARGTGRRRQGS